MFQVTTARFCGAALQCVTPFSDKGEVMLDRAADEFALLDAGGGTGVMVNDCASEALAMSELARDARAANEGVIAGSTSEAIGCVRRYEALGLDLVAVATPTLSPFGSRAMGEYVKAVARASDLPAFGYSSPDCGHKLPPETGAELAQACVQGDRRQGFDPEADRTPDPNEVRMRRPSGRHVGRRGADGPDHVP